MGWQQGLSARPWLTPGQHSDWATELSCTCFAGYAGPSAMASWSWGTCRQLPWWVRLRPSTQVTRVTAAWLGSRTGEAAALLQRRAGSMRRLPLRLRGWVLRDALACREGPGRCCSDGTSDAQVPACGSVPDCCGHWTCGLA